MIFVGILMSIATLFFEYLYYKKKILNPNKDSPVENVTAEYNGDMQDKNQYNTQYSSKY